MRREAREGLFQKSRPPHFGVGARERRVEREPTSGHGDGSSAAVLHGADRLHRRHVGRTRPSHLAVRTHYERTDRARARAFLKSSRFFEVDLERWVGGRGAAAQLERCTDAARCTGARTRLSRQWWWAFNC